MAIKNRKKPTRYTGCDDVHIAFLEARNAVKQLRRSRHSGSDPTILAIEAKNTIDKLKDAIIDSDCVEK